jgi:hypothetical protein
MATQYTAGLTAGQVLTAATMNQIGAVSETYTPTWTSSGTQPAIGNGILTGRYFQIQKLVFVQILFQAGSTTTFGTGEYRFAVPITARAGLYNFMSNGIARFYDLSAGTGQFGQAGFFAGATTYFNVYTTNATVAGATNPFTFASGDEILMALWYEAA